ncbi:MAG: hypothetical protein WAT66_03080 [Actinomycetota bacterium]
MRKRIRIATAVGALGAALVLLLPLATGAGAAATSVSDYQMTGIARGISLGFGFKDFVIPKILDLGIPHASNELNTSAGASSAAEAAMAYPGDVLVGALQPQFPGGIPGYAVSKYPPGQSQNRNVTGSLFGNDIPLPNTFGPLGVDAGHLETDAREKKASASTTTQRLNFGDALAPLLTVGSISSTSSAKAEASKVTQIARTAVHDLVITPSAGLTIKIGTIVSEAIATSDGTTSDGDASLTLSDVRVIQGTTTYAATIDSKGIHVTGVAPEDAPNTVDINLSQSIGNVTQGLQNSGLTIRTANASRIIDGASSEASIGGLLIGLGADIPRVPVAQQVITEIIGPIMDKNFPTYCPSQDERIPPPFDQIAKALPVCVTPQLIPTGGTGTITSLAIGSVDAASAASTGFVQTPVVGGNDSFGPGAVGGFGPGVSGPDLGNGGVVPDNGQQQQPQNTRLYGLVARLPASALLGGGLTFLVIAMAMTIGPSLRRWRAT